MRRDYPETYNRFLLVFSDMTAGLRDTGLLIREDEESPLAQLLRTVHSEFEHFLREEGGDWDELTSEERIDLFADLASASIELVPDIKNPGLNQVLAIADQVSDVSFLLRKDQRTYLNNAIEAYAQVVKRRKSHLSDFFPTLSVFLKKAFAERSEEREASTIIRKLLGYGYSASLLEKDPTYEAYWLLQVAARDKRLDRSYEEIDRITRFVNALSAQGEKESLRIFEDLLYRGLPGKELLDDLIRLHEATGVVNFSRLWKDTDDRLVHELLKNLNDRTYNGEKPVLVVILPRGGAGQTSSLMQLGSAMDTFRNEHDRLLALTRDFKVFVYEAASVTGFDLIRKDLEPREGELRTRRFGVYLAGHGNATSVNLNSSMFGETHYERQPIPVPEGKVLFDSTDQKSGSIVNSKGFYPTDGKKARFDLSDPEDRYQLMKLATGAMFVLFEACGTGAGNTNVATFVAEASPGTIVVAPTREITSMALDLPGKREYTVEEMRGFVTYYDGENRVEPLVVLKKAPAPNRGKR